MPFLELIPKLYLPALLTVAVLYDLRAGKIPNWLTFPAMLGGLAAHTFLNGWQGFLFSGAGALAGMGLLLLFYIGGGMGAGDVKLMGAIGAVLGARNVFAVFLLTALIGGAYGLGVLAWRGRLKETLARYGRMFKGLLVTRELIYIPPPAEEQLPRLRYGLAIAAGVLVSFAI